MPWNVILSAPSSFSVYGLALVRITFEESVPIKEIDLPARPDNDERIVTYSLYIPGAT
jgi:hypothetical protein